MEKNSAISYINDNEKGLIRNVLLDTGACAVGFAEIDVVSTQQRQRFNSWLERGENAGMDYMHNYPELRFNPAGLLENASTLVSIAYPYRIIDKQNEGVMISSYAYYKDYHKALRKVLKPALVKLSANFPEGHFRICIDSAPVMERYWAQRAGIGFSGDNGTLIVPGFGSLVFLVEIITDLHIAADMPCLKNCGHCGACIKACPGKAINPDGTINCHRCISYLTIEHRGGWESNDSIEVMNTPEGKSSLFGCDICLKVCPHNLNVASSSQFTLEIQDEILQLSAETILGISSDAELKSRFPCSPIGRAGISGLHRNAGNSRSI